MLERVVARVRRLLHEAANVEVEVVGTECDTIDEVRVAAAGFGQGFEERVGAGESPMGQFYEGFDRDRARAEPQGVAERAVGVRKTEKEIAVFGVRTADEGASVSGQN